MIEINIPEPSLTLVLRGNDVQEFRDFIYVASGEYAMAEKIGEALS